MNKTSAWIFDVDGTLADTEREGHLPAFNEAFKLEGLGWYWSPELYGSLLNVTGGKERIRFYANEHDPEFLNRDDADAIIRKVHEEKTRLYVQRVSSGAIPLRPGVLDMLNVGHQAGIRLAIATTTTAENVDALLKAVMPTGADKWFEVIGAGDVVPRKKPAPDIYLWVLDRLGLEPESCLAIEDSENGLQASLAAGLPTLVTVNDYTRGQNFKGALRVVDSMALIRPADFC
jgi:HAD superfamily hydrolase (TIGR01509 family)